MLNRDGSGGKPGPKPRATREAILDAIENCGGARGAQTGDVANELDITPEWARQRLAELLEDGAVEREEIGPSYVWRVAEE